MAEKVESRMGAVAWAMRQRAGAHPRSSNRTCRSPASGSPTGFTVRHTTGQLGAGVRDAADRVAEIHVLDASHFALDEKVDEIAALMLDFLGKHLGSSN